MRAKIVSLWEKKSPTLKPWVWGSVIFLAPSVIVLVLHMIKPVRVVHVDMGRLMKIHAVHLAQEGIDDPMTSAQDFKQKIQEMGRKKSWVFTEQAWGDPKIIQTMRDVTDEVACLLEKSPKVVR